MNYKIAFVLALALTFGLTVAISRKLIPFLKSKKMGQKILDIGPRWHKSKEGTPTMGGFAFIIASVVAGIAGSVYFAVTDGLRSTLPFIMTLALGVAGGLIGCIDDSAKLRKAQNEGLTARQKFLLQLFCFYLLFCTHFCTGCVFQTADNCICHFFDFIGSKCLCIRSDNQSDCNRLFAFRNLFAFVFINERGRFNQFF